MSPNVDTDKVNVREVLITHRRSRSAAERLAGAEAIALHAQALPALTRARRVAAHLSLPSEPGTGPLLQWLLGRGTEVIVPISNADHSLEWVSFDGSNPPAGRFGIPEPTGPRLGTSALLGCDMALVPALAVDHAGNRLGRGAGYYDRALAPFTALICAVVFEDEILPEVPHAAHDQRVDLVLTPAGTFRPERT